MRRLILASLVLGPGAVLGCDRFGGPRLAVGTGPEKSSPWSELPGRPKRNVVYGGRTPEQWGQSLGDPDRDEVLEAIRALQVLGSDGRPYILRGVTHSRPETRRLCLEALTVSDFRRQAEKGRQTLVRLASDPADVRIRERAMSYLVQWEQAPPSLKY